MKEEEIKELFEQFETIANEYKGIECWSARELAQVLGYSQWRNFEGIIEKAKASCVNAGQEIHTILLMSTKWFSLVLVLNEKLKTTC